MEGLDFSRLNPTAFERLVRALCFAQLGPAGTVFSPGPDGGRDFIYEGQIKGYEAKKWDGYLRSVTKHCSSGKAEDSCWFYGRNVISLSEAEMGC